MPKRYAAEDLVGVAEIASDLHVSTSVVHDWRRRHPSFPQPVAKLRMGLLWSLDDVRRWAESTGRRG